MLCLSPFLAAAPTGPFPTWKHLSSASGDLPVPAGGKEQTSLLVFDVDRDGRNDIVIAERSAAPAVVWLRRHADGWTQHTIESNRAPIAAGGTFGDVDGDGDPDIVFGSSGQGSHVWWRTERVTLLHATRAQQLPLSEQQR
jgi:hypothetical protein